MDIDQHEAAREAGEQCGHHRLVRVRVRVRVRVGVRVRVRVVVRVRLASREHAVVAEAQVV